MEEVSESVSGAVLAERLRNVQHSVERIERNNERFDQRMGEYEDKLTMTDIKLEKMMVKSSVYGAIGAAIGAALLQIIIRYLIK